MKSKEREKLAIVRGLLNQVVDALAENPIKRGLALGSALDAKDLIEQLTAKKPAGGAGE